MIALCIDPSFRHLGFSVIDYKPQQYITIKQFGVIEVKKRKAKVGELAVQEAEDMGEISYILDSVIKVWKPDIVVAELPAGSRSCRAARLLGAATAIVVAVCEFRHVPVQWHGAREVKKRITGNSQATKDEIMAWARGRFVGVDFPKTKERFEHIADSIAVFYAHFLLQAR